MYGWLIAMQCVAPTPGHSEGSVGFKEELLPLFRSKPMLGRFVLATFEVTGSPMGVRISEETIPALSGTRVGSYRVPVTWHEDGKPRAAVLTINTTQVF